jgi:hypothetical protein
MQSRDARTAGTDLALTGELVTGTLCSGQDRFAIVDVDRA